LDSVRVIERNSHQHDVLVELGLGSGYRGIWTLFIALRNSLQRDAAVTWTLFGIEEFELFSWRIPNQHDAMGYGGIGAIFLALRNPHQHDAMGFELFSLPCGILINVMLCWDLDSVRIIEWNFHQHDVLVGLGLCSDYSVLWTFRSWWNLDLFWTCSGEVTESPTRSSLYSLWQVETVEDAWVETWK
jgi:hypothetical protein